MDGPIPLGAVQVLHGDCLGSSFRAERLRAPNTHDEQSGSRAFIFVQQRPGGSKTARADGNESEADRSPAEFKPPSCLDCVESGAWTRRESQGLHEQAS